VVRDISLRRMSRGFQGERYLHTRAAGDEAAFRRYVHSYKYFEVVGCMLTVYQPVSGISPTSNRQPTPPSL